MPRAQRLAAAVFAIPVFLTFALAIGGCGSGTVPRTSNSAPSPEESKNLEAIGKRDPSKKGEI